MLPGNLTSVSTVHPLHSTPCRLWSPMLSAHCPVQTLSSGTETLPLSWRRSRTIPPHGKRQAAQPSCPGTWLSQHPTLDLHYFFAFSRLLCPMLERIKEMLLSSYLLELNPGSPAFSQAPATPLSNQLLNIPGIPSPFLLCHSNLLLSARVISVPAPLPHSSPLSISTCPGSPNIN